MICIYKEDTRRIVDFFKQGEQKGDKFVGSNGTRFLNENMKIAEIPNQDLGQYYKQNDGNILKEIYYPEDIQINFSTPFLDPTAEYDAKVVDIDTSRSDKKYLKVERDVEGQTISAWCYVSGTLYHQYQAGEFDMGDRVVVSFARNLLDYPYAQDRVVGF